MGEGEWSEAHDGDGRREKEEDEGVEDSAFLRHLGMEQDQDLTKKMY